MKPWMIWMSVALMTSCCAKQDQLLGSWVEPIPGMEDQQQGICIEAEGKASSINMHTLVYKSWSREGDRVLLTGESLGNGQSFSFTDTLTLLKLDADSLVLQRGAMVTRYARQKE